MQVRQNLKLFQPVLYFFRTDFKSMNFELEAEKIPSEIFEKKSFVVQKRKVTEIQPAENLLQTLPKKSFVKKIMEEKVGKKYSLETQKLSFGAFPTLNIGNISLISNLKLRVKIQDKNADTNTILKCDILTELKRKEQAMFKSESVELGIIPIGSVISDIPMMRTAESISTLIVACTKKALRPVISKNKWVTD